VRHTLYPHKYRARALGSVVLATAAASTSPSVLAQQASSTEGTFGLGTIEVYGHREGTAPTQSSDVVTADTLATAHREDLSEALDLVPGVSVQNLGQRRERLIALRGFSSRQVPLFIDGIPVYVPYDGNVDLARFGVDYVSEIVVSKGLTSLLYGPNILGGAVNVISRKPTQPFTASAKLASETDDRFDSTEQRATASLGASSDLWYGYISARATICARTHALTA